MNNYGKTQNDIVTDTLSNLAKRQARRDYFRRSLLICSAVFTLSVALGGILYIRFSSRGQLPSADSNELVLPFSYGFKESLRRLLKLFALLLSPVVLQFVSGFTLFSQYICLPVTLASGTVCGGVALYFTSDIFTSSPSPKFIACYVIFIVLGALYCTACVCMSCVSMSFSFSLRHNSKTNSRLNENDTAEYFNFFTSLSTGVLLLVLFYCIFMYAIAIFK